MKDIASETLGYFDKQISEIHDRDESAELEMAVQTVRDVKPDSLAIESGILLNMVDYPIGDVLTLNEIATQVVDPANLEKWRDVDPMVVADLKKSEDIAAEVSRRRGINIEARINKALVTLYATLRQSPTPADTSEIHNVVDGLIEAWKLYRNWIHSNERRRFSTQKTNSAGQP